MPRPSFIHQRWKLADDGHGRGEIAPVPEMVAQRGRLPEEELGEGRASHRDGFSGGAARRDVEGLAVGARIGVCPYAISLRLQIRARQQRKLVPAGQVVWKTLTIEGAVTTRVVEQRI